MKTNEFCKDGSLTNFALSCGCIQTGWNDSGTVKITLCKESRYFITKHHKAGEVIYTDYFDKLTEAKKHFRYLRARQK